jgi:hypothetical protein
MGLSYHSAFRDLLVSMHFETGIGIDKWLITRNQHMLVQKFSREKCICLNSVQILACSVCYLDAKFMVLCILDEVRLVPF